jgi:hypothetical protein
VEGDGEGVPMLQVERSVVKCTMLPKGEQDPPKVEKNQRGPIWPGRSPGRSGHRPAFFSNGGWRARKASLFRTGRVGLAENRACEIRVDSSGNRATIARAVVI